MYVIFKFDVSKKEVVVEKTGSPGESYNDFMDSLPTDDYSYAAYDLDIVSDNNCGKSKIFFISCCMFVSYHHEALRRCNLEGQALGQLRRNHIKEIRRPSPIPNQI